MQPYEDLVRHLCSIPGIDVLTAWTLIAELGPDVTVFPDAAHAVSWAGLCPGNRESAGKRLSGRTRKGNRWLRRALCQSAWAVTHKRDCYLTAHFYRRAAQHGVKKAIVATAHQLLIIAYHLLRDGTVYRELGGNFYDTFWRLDRIRSLEMGIYALGRTQFAANFDHEDPAARPRLIDVHTFLTYEKQIRNLQLQEARLLRYYGKASAELRQLQRERKTSEIDELDTQPFDPSENGFDFSNPDIERYRQPHDVAQAIDLCGLP